MTTMTLFGNSKIYIAIILFLTSLTIASKAIENKILIKINNEFL